MVFPTFADFESNLGWEVTSEKQLGKYVSLVNPSGNGVVLKVKNTWGMQQDTTLLVQHNGKFCPLESDGPFASFKAETKNAVKIDPTRIALSIDKEDEHWHLVDLRNGEKYLLESKLVKTILSPYPLLLEDFNRERDKNPETMLRYVAKANQLLAESD